MRIGLIGLGRIGAFHAGTLVGIPAIKSLVVTDLVPERTKQVVDRHRSDGVEGVDSLEALLASGVDGVIIAAGTDAHPDLILACVEAGLPTLCEKPVAQTGAAGAELLRRLEGCTVPVQIGSSAGTTPPSPRPGPRSSAGSSAGSPRSAPPRSTPSLRRPSTWRSPVGC